MDGKLNYNVFNKLFSDNNKCLEEVVRVKYPQGIICQTCERITKHYKVRTRPVYECKFCRTQTHPLTGTLFEKSSTPLSIWFLALYIMTQTRAGISIKTLQNELGVTYKTAWRMYKNIYGLMELNKRDLLTDTQVNKWVIFNTIELKVTRKI